MLEKKADKQAQVTFRSRPVDRIVLTGFRATGKSAVGKRLAEVLGYRFIDTDEELAAGMKCTIGNYVGRHGWSAFREAERRLLARLAGGHHLVIATGGGSIMHREEWRSLRKRSLVVWLQADAGTIRHRLRHDGGSAARRPSLTGEDVLAEVDGILAAREPLYRQGSDVAIDTAGRSPETMVSLIMTMLTVAEKE